MIHGGVDRGKGWWGTVRKMSGVVWRMMMMMMMMTKRSGWRALAKTVIAGAVDTCMAPTGADGGFCS